MEKKLHTLFKILINRGILSEEVLFKNDTISEDSLDIAISELKHKKNIINQLIVVYEIGNLLKFSSRDDEVFNSILFLIRDIIDYDFSSIYFYRDNKFELIEKVGEKIDLNQKIDIAGANSIKEFIIKEKSQIYFNKLDNDNINYRSIILVPIIINNELEGVLAIAKKEDDGFDENSQLVLDLITNEIAINLERYKYIEKIETKNERLNNLLHELEKSKEKLIKAEKVMAVTQTIVGINHEINNALSIEKGALYLLKNKLKKNNFKEYENYIEKIEEGHKRIKEIVRNLDKVKKQYKIKKYIEDIDMIDLGDFKKDEKKEGGSNGS